MAEKKAKPTKAVPAREKKVARGRVYEAPAKDKLDAVGIDEICGRIAQCEFISTIAASIGVSPAALHAYLSEHHEAYMRAREQQADKLVEDMMAIADEAKTDTYIDEHGNTVTNQEVIARSRLRVEARKWLAGKMRPRVYGDKVVVGGDEDAPPIKTVTRVELVAVAPKPDHER